jgi:cysteinyl-tRNA synthetase
MPDMPLFLSDTLTRSRRPFVPDDPRRVTMYVCGPTVYNPAHVGNFRPPTAFDVLFRLLRRFYGAEHVVYAANVTDIDDRIIAKAAAEGVPMTTVTARYEAMYREDAAALGILPPTFTPRATEHVDGIIGVIQKLMACGCAYAVPSGVYFCVAADDDYGKLSGRAQEDLLAGARVEGESDKRAPSDFALWKAAKPGEPQWQAPFGAGRPGWHIECSAMIAAQLGETIDIHAGGVDLIFPHHENEIAQSESATGKPLARYWLHNGFLDMAGEKMSKSLGNVVLLHDLLKEWPGEVVRFALLSAHYRAPLEFTRTLLEQSRASLDRLYRALQRLKAVEPLAEEAHTVLAALCDDLNTPEALAALFALAAAANKTEDPAEQARLKGQMRDAGALLGLLQADPDQWFRGDEAEAGEIDALVAARIEARKAKNWAEADRIREALSARGVEVMDGPAGSTWRRIG